MLPIRNISYLLPMCCSFWEKCKNSPKTSLGCSTPLTTTNLIDISIWYCFHNKISNANTKCLFNQALSPIYIEHAKALWHQNKTERGAINTVNATVRFRWHWSSLPCLVQFSTWLHVLECRNFWNTLDDSLWIKHQIIVSVTETSFKMASTLCQKCLTIFLFVRKQQILYGLDHTILSKFHQHVIQILIK